MSSALDSLEPEIIQEPLTNRIRVILDEYPDGTQIARELLQNSDDARSTVQWYLLDHRDHVKHARLGNPISSEQPLRLIHKDFHKYMGPALLAGNDSVFEDKDFKSLRNLASSEKRTDESKIGQMGIGFNSIYHLTDCPSFITGDQFMVIDPHLQMFKNSAPAVRGPLQVLSSVPDQLQAFSVLEDIDCSKGYEGTIFRFPLRTEEQEQESKISDYAYTPAKALEMLVKLKDEALKALLFLRHVEKIVIYERKEDQDKPTKLFEIEIVNAGEVRTERIELLKNLKAHADPNRSASQDDVLKYSVRPTYRITQEDGSITEETWHITTLVGNVIKSRKYMEARTDGNISNHKLIPWVGIAAPSDSKVKIDISRLFCFLPIGIQLPFPVHINGHFAVKQSRREIWTNQDNDFSSQAAANIKSLWNVHLFETQVPEAYAMFLENVSLDHGANYDLWPTSCGEGIGLDAIWKDLLKNVLMAVLLQDRKVFFCGSRAKDNCYLRKYSTLYIAQRDMDQHPLLKESLHSMISMAEDMPDIIQQEITALVATLGLDQVILTPAHVRQILFDNKERWASTADSATRVDMLKYCLLDNNIADLEGLPLLPLDGDIWVDFEKMRSHERFFVPRMVFETLSQANASLVDLNVEGYPFGQIHKAFRRATFWTSMPASSIAKRIRWAFHRGCYQDGQVPTGCISQSREFPSDDWIMDFWDMAHELPDSTELFSGLAGLHLFPVGRGQLAPLSKEHRVIYIDSSAFGISEITDKVAAAMEQHLHCSVLRPWFRHPSFLLLQFVIEIHRLPGLLDLLSNVTPDQFAAVSQQDREYLAKFLTLFLQPTVKLSKEQHHVLRRLPVFKRYGRNDLGALDAALSSTRQLRLARGYDGTEHPWLPHSIDLLADDQPMKEHLRVMLEIPVLSESEYWHVLVSNLVKRDEGDWDAVLTKLAPTYHVHSKAFDLASILCKLPFVTTRTAGGSQPKDTQPTLACRLSPQSVVHPSLASYFQDKDSVFPTGIYSQAPLFGILSELGMYSTFDSTFVQERLTTLFGAKILSMEKDRHLVETLYGRLNSEYSEAFLTPKLRSVLTIVPWVYTGSDGGWRTPAGCRPHRDRDLVGDKMLIAQFTFTNDALLDCIGWNSPPPLATVLDNLLFIIDRYTQQQADSDSVTSSESSAHQNVTHADSVSIHRIYQYLNSRLEEPTALREIRQKLQNRTWILVAGTFYTVDRVALKMHCDLQPHFVQLPATNLNEFYLALGVREHVIQEDMEGILANVGARYPEGGPVSQMDADLVYRLLSGIAYGQNPTWSADLLLLTEGGCLKRATDVVYDDVNIRQSDISAEDLPYTFAHRRISHEMAELLSIVMFSERCWEDTKDNSFDPFFQQENIVDRIKSILNDYDPSSIFNEFLQNAADAGATECRFWLDSRSFKADKILSKKMAAWQGPALMIYNNAEFSNEDFDALCRLGVGNKKEDTSKIGRHGLGFNSVYHFTDVPSIVSGPYIGFFDPHMTNLPKSRDRSGAPIAKGGHRCDFRKLSMETLADQLEPYKGILGCDMRSHFKGTLFRIPLRMRRVDAMGTPLASISPEVLEAQSGSEFFGDEGWSLAQVRRMMEDWVSDAKIGLLFLNNIKTIRISDGLKPQVTVDKSKVAGFDFPLTQNSNSSLSLEGPRPPATVIKIKVSSDGATPSKAAGSTWLVCCEGAFPLSTSIQIRQLAAKRFWNPHRGVAIKLEDTDLSEFHCRLFVHLPTPILTDLPFHIHGDFALTSNRKNLAGGSEEDNDKRIWNSYLTGICLPETVICAIQHLFNLTFILPSSPGCDMKGFDSALRSYFERWPVRTTKEFQPFLKAFLRRVHSSQLFPCYGIRAEFPMRPELGSEAIFPGPVIVPPELESKIFPWLRQRAWPVCMVPDPVVSVLKAEWNKEPQLRYAQVDGDFIRLRVRETPNFLKDDMKTKKEREWIMGWVLQPILNPRVKVSVSPDTLQVIPLLNGEWMQLTGGRNCYVATEHELRLLSAKNILVDKDFFSTKELDRALQLLVDDAKYDVNQLPESVFASTFLEENPGALTDPQIKQIWDYIEDEYVGLWTFYNFPILKTVYGTMTKLGDVKTGFQITGLPYQTAQKFIVFMDLLRDLGIVVYESAAHRNHKYFETGCPEYSDLRLLTAIVSRWNESSTHRTLTRIEAKGMRELVMKCRDTIDQDLIPGIANLPIWITQGSTDTSSLIAARGAYYLEGHFDLGCFGIFPTVVSSGDAQIFKLLGADPLRIAAAMTDFVLPMFHRGVIKCEGNIKTSYLDLLTNLLYVSTRRGKVAVAPNEVQRASRCYLARDGSFHAQEELIVPGEDLTETVFANRPGIFADREMASLMAHYSMLNRLRSLSNNPELVVECAEKVLAETVDAGAAPIATRAQAVQLIKYIYDNPSAGGVDWIDAKWKIVPRETNLEPPYDLFAPNLPLYVSFLSLTMPNERDLTWTQIGFFPADLIPPAGFRLQFPNASSYSVNLVLKHLNTLVKRISPLWKTTEQQLSLRAHLFKIYKCCEDFSKRNDSCRECITRELPKHLKVPYILNSNSKDPSEASSWVWPAQLMFDIDNSIPSHQVVDPILHQYRSFLVAAGAAEFVTVGGTVQVADGRARGGMEDQIQNCFETQDRQTGFMDVRFEFQDGTNILAHKVVLARASEFFFRRFTGVWASTSTRDPKEPGVEIVDLSGYGDIKDGFWGLLYYYYSDTLIQSNGPPVFEYEKNPQGALAAEAESGQDDSDEDEGDTEDGHKAPVEDKLAQRVQYLMELQDVANRFDVPRLKDLIAQELIMGQNVIHSNVFSIRGHAEHNQADNIREHCDLFIEKNKASVIKYVEGEIRVLREELEKLDRREAREDGDDGDYEPSELSDDSEDDEVGMGSDALSDDDNDGNESTSSAEDDEEAEVQSEDSVQEQERDDDEEENDAEQIVEAVSCKLRGLIIDPNDEDDQLKDRQLDESEWDEEESAEWTAGEDDWDSDSSCEDSGSEGGENEKVDAIGYLNTISPFRASLEEDLRELEENLKELLAEGKR
ncbi:hypothetical protein BGW39_008978 [Mortierella sp. 14UC]|nr:hypothetical protein BGW39_008978 [Mortierella sp. 14UC]